MKEPQMKMIQSIAQALYDRKGSNILAIDVREVSSMTNFYIIAEGAVERHVQALSREVVAKFRELGYQVLHVEGDQTGDWMVVDCGEIMIHILTPEMRERYALEQLWKDGKLIELDIKKEDE
jgi:ribosome-associated protein